MQPSPELNGPADRIHSFSSQIIKSRQNAITPNISQIRFDLSLQSSEPMPLAGSADTGVALAGLQFGCDARTNGFYTCLKTFKIFLRPKSEDTSAVRTTASLYLHGMIASVKIGQNITVTPYPTAVATLAVVQLWPWVISPHINKFLEIHWKKNYHYCHVFFKPVLAGLVFRAVALL